MAYNIEKSIEFNRNLAGYIPGGEHSNFQYLGRIHKIHYIKGSGSRLWDIDGNEYLDMYCRSGANILGHGNPSYTSALVSTINQLTAIDLGTLEIGVCQQIQELYASAEMVRFSLSGTEAIQNAIRLARAYTKKNRVLRFDGNYHGNADNILGGKAESEEYPIPHDTDRFHYTEGRAKDVLESQSFIVPWNDFKAVTRLLNKFADEVACIITEPISINGGGYLPADGFLEHLRAECDRHKILLIFDEVITGFRVSAGGAQKLYHISPDITVLGKALGGGSVPISAIAGKKDIMKLYSSRKVVHGGTFNGYQLGLSAAKATIEILSQAENSYERMEKFGEVIRRITLMAASKSSVKIGMYGFPTCQVMSCRNADGTPMYDSPKVNSLVEALLAQHMILNGIILTNGNRFYTNLANDDQDLEFYSNRVAIVFETVGEMIKKYI